MKVILASRDSGARLQEIADVEFKERASPMSAKVVRVEPKVKYQQIVGFGGAFTKASASTLHKMSPAKQEEIMKAYFDPRPAMPTAFASPTSTAATLRWATTPILKPRATPN